MVRADVDSVAAGRGQPLSQYGGTIPGGTIVRANHQVCPDFLISWQPWPVRLSIFAGIAL